MRIKAAILIVVTVFAFAAEVSAEWLERDFTNTWQGAAAFVNGSCRPADLGGIQTVWIQPGHGAGYTLFVFCRKDMKPNATYKFNMSLVSPDTLTSTATTILGNPSVKLGGYYYGNYVGKDGLLYIEKIR